MALEQVIRHLQQQASRLGEESRESPRRGILRELTRRVHRRLIDTSDFSPFAPDAREQARRLNERYVDQEEAGNPLLVLTAAERFAVEDAVLTALFGYSILTPYLHNPEITEIMVNGLAEVFVEQSGKLVRAFDSEGRPVAFCDTAEALAVIERIVAPLNRKVDESTPIVDARLPDGSRVNIVLPPVALKGPSITIRRFPKNPFSLEQLTQRDMLSTGLSALLTALVRARYNIVVSGGTSSGKTTMLNAMSMLIADERVVTAEDSAELQLSHVANLVGLEGRPANIEGKGQITIRDLVRTALRMRPDRIIVGEVRSGEAVDMLQAMNTGHDGSLTTVHANSAHDVVSRLETMVLMSDMELPVKAIRQQIASSVEAIVHLSREKDGRRRVMEVCEVAGIDSTSEQVVLTPLCRWDPQAAEDGAWVWSGQQMTRTRKFAQFKVPLPPRREDLECSGSL